MRRRSAEPLAFLLVAGLSRIAHGDQVWFVPAIVDARGLNGSHFTTELTVLNDGDVPANVKVTYIAADSVGATGSGTVEEVILPRRQLVLGHAIDWLRTKGLPIPLSGTQVGTLRVEISGGTFGGRVLARTSTPSGAGRAGTGSLAQPISPYSAQFSPQFVFGLREDESERSNLAVAHAGTVGPITLRISLYPADGLVEPVLLPDLTLGPGQWRQFNSVLADAGFANGYAQIERVGGTDPFFTYGVVNDNVTNDGALTEGSDSVSSALPSVAVESSAFDSDLVIANPGADPVYVRVYLAGLSSSAVLQVGAREQRTIPSILAFLREAGLPVAPLGSVSVWPLVLDSAYPPRVFGSVRTYARAAGGGRYSEFSSVGTGGNLLPGLTQDEISRSNLALVHDPRFDFPHGPYTYPVIAVYDGDTGEEHFLRSPPSVGLMVAPNGSTWCQWNSVLSQFGIRRGWVRLTSGCTSDPDNSICVGWQFGAYASIVDGVRPGDGTGDATIIP